MKRISAADYFYPSIFSISPGKCSRSEFSFSSNLFLSFFLRFLLTTAGVSTSKPIPLTNMRAFSLMEIKVQWSLGFNSYFVSVMFKMHALYCGNTSNHQIFCSLGSVYMHLKSSLDWWIRSIYNPKEGASFIPKLVSGLSPVCGRIDKLQQSIMYVLSRDAH